MEREPLLASQVSESLINKAVYEDIEDPFHSVCHDSSSSYNRYNMLDPSIEDEFTPPGRVKHGLTRSRSAGPAMPIIRDFKYIDQTPEEKIKHKSSSIVRQGLLLLIIYLILGGTVYSFNKENFSGSETHLVVDAIYFCVVTLCTVGYGDIAPLTPGTKVFACIFVLVGFGFINILLRGLVNYTLSSVANSQINVGRTGSSDGFSARNNILDMEKGRMRTRMKVGLALGVVILCIGMGATVLHFVEKFDVVDSIYLSVMSVTTVGSYGGKAFNTVQGRLFASLWLLVSTLSVAKTFLYLAELRIEKRHRSMAKWILQKDITVEDLFSADINTNGFISKAEFAMLKLKQMGMINEKDILLVCNQFDKIDQNNSGKITISDLQQWS
ncbi:hypothetical protein MKW94_003357 [Papaver nudicaule]|uniref:EF-hand domain-containing protein n=1 Tax=Papaver nudicaule TaxID=74823 RepID=A0AA41VIH3_PAPNU|nr:hypothetical protein [Papaver nudicaule]